MSLSKSITGLNFHCDSFFIAKASQLRCEAIAPALFYFYEIIIWLFKPILRGRNNFLQAAIPNPRWQQFLDRKESTKIAPVTGQLYLDIISVIQIAYVSSSYCGVMAASEYTENLNAKEMELFACLNFPCTQRQRPAIRITGFLC